MALVILIDRERVVDEGVGLPLHHLEDGRGLLVEDEEAGLLEGRRCELVAGGPLLHRHRPPLHVEVIGPLHRRLRPHEEREPRLQVGLREGDRLRPLRGRRHRRDDAVDLADLQGGDEAVEADVLDHHVAFEVLPEGLGNPHAHARRLAGRVGHLERRVGQFHAHLEGRGRGGGCWGEAGSHGQGNSEEETIGAHSEPSGPRER